MNRETKKALTKQQLIASATALFRENGIHNTDLKSIAADAGVSVVTFYKYFDSKDTLVREIANDELNNLFDRIMAIADSPDLTILDKIKAFATLTATAQKKIATTYGPEMITLLETDDAHIRAVADTRRDTFFTTIIEQGRSEGFFNADVSTAAIRGLKASSMLTSAPLLFAYTSICSCRTIVKKPSLLLRVKSISKQSISNLNNSFSTA